MLKLLSELNNKEKAVWALFCFTCFQLTTKFPNITLVPGERTKVFSGLLCGATLFVLLVIKKRALCFSSSEWLICFVLSAICIASGFTSGYPPSSLWRGITLIFSAVGGFWCGRLLLNTSYYRDVFAWMCLVLFTLLVLLGLVGHFLYGNVLYVADIHKHPFNGLILLLSYGPLWLLFQKKRWETIIGIICLFAGYYAISLSFDPMIWFPPLLFLGALYLLNKRKRYIYRLLCNKILLSE